MLRSWYSEKDDKEEEYLDRFDDTWIMPDRLFVFLHLFATWKQEKQIPAPFSS